MTHAVSVTRGVDLDTFEGFAAHVAEHPEDVQLGLRARSTDGGTCAHGLVSIDVDTLGGEPIPRDTHEYATGGGPTGSAGGRLR